MRKLTKALGMSCKSFLFVLLSIFVVTVGCNKTDTQHVVVPPVDTTPTVVVNPTIEVSSVPSFPLWYNDPIVTRIEYSSTNATSVKLNGVILDKLSGQVSFSNLKNDTTLVFEAFGAGNKSASKVEVIKVFTQDQTIPCIKGNIWNMVSSRRYNSSNNYLGYYNPQCWPIKFYATGDTGRMYKSLCTPPSNDGQINWYFDYSNNQKKMNIAGLPYQVVSLSLDSLVLLRNASGGDYIVDTYK